MIIIHAAIKNEYEKEIKTGHYGQKSLDRYGFVHCSELDTYHLVAPNFKDDESERVLLVIDPEKLNCEVKWEDGGGLDFPHVYGLLDKGAIIGVYPHLWSETRVWVPNKELEKVADWQ